jgi:hypothetical protein
MNTKTIICERVDMKLLHKQKKELVKLIWNDQNTNLWGLVHLIDDIEDRNIQKTK